MHHHDANGLAVRRGDEHKTADDEANRFSSHRDPQFLQRVVGRRDWILPCADEVVE
jgi:hypothetical protein